jgi:hypothetical protein
MAAALTPIRIANDAWHFIIPLTETSARRTRYKSKKIFSLFAYFSPA